MFCQARVARSFLDVWNTNNKKNPDEKPKFFLNSMKHKITKMLLIAYSVQIFNLSKKTTAHTQTPMFLSSALLIF
jgi:hypothetical protein